MDELPNTHYIPSFFKVTKSGRELILSQFRDVFPDIFAGYEPAINAFFITTNNEKAIRTLLGYFRSQIELFQRGKVGDAPESPKMLPLKDTIYERDVDSIPSTTQLSKLDTNQLIDLDEDSEESSSESSLSEDCSTYWIPRTRGIGILQRDLANSIAEQTGCIFCPEPEYKRVRLISGNTQAALAKLQRIESLLLLLARQGSNPVQAVDHNLLSLSCESKGTGVMYVSTLRDPHNERIMVDTKLEDRVESMFIGEEQIYNEQTGKYSRAQNLNTIHTKDDLAVSSKIWDDYELKSFGDPQNALPQVSSAGTSVASTIGPLKPNENMGLLDQARVREWSKNIDVRADPTQPVSSPALSEPAVEGFVSVRTVARFDSDEEAEMQPAEEITHRIVAQDSDDETDDWTPAPTPNRGQRSMPNPEPRPRSSEEEPAHGRRVDRANRYRADVPAFRDSPLPRAPTGLVAADTFFAHVPRDKNAHGEARFQNPTSRSGQAAAVNEEREQIHLPQGKPPRRLGLDGASDEPDQDNLPPRRPAHNEPAPRFPRGPLTQSRPLSPKLPSEYKTGPGFDPNNYGAATRNGRNESSRRYATQSNVPPSNASHADPVSTWPRAPDPANANPARRRREAPEFQQRQNRDQLIDCSDGEERRSATVGPPPGLSPISKTDEFDTSSPFHLLDTPLDDIQRPSIKPAWDDAPVPVYDGTSVSTSISSGNHPYPLDYNIQTKINKPDIGYIRNDMVSQLKALQVKRKVKKPAEIVPRQSLERIDPGDEVSTRKFYNTMNLKAPNAGKGKKGKGTSSNLGKSETAAQKAERIAKQKADLGVPTGPARRPQAPTQQATPEKLTPKALQAAKANPRMAQMHAESLQEASRKTLAREVVERMKMPFEAARVFPGYLDFELQIGQLLVVPTSKIESKPNTVYESDKWKTMFDNGVSSAEVFFTNLLTCSGSDADGILEAKAGGSKMWNKDVPGRCAVILDFECQDASGSEFTLQLNMDGTHTASKDSFVLQQVGLQCPGRTWDTCAVFKGVPVWHNIPEGLQMSIAELVGSVHVRAGYQVDLFFRTPSNNSLIVREVLAKRISRHNSQLLDEEDLQLKIVESKTLYMTGHKKDKRLTRCTEKEQGVMSQDDRVHYEVSLANRTINAGFDENKTLQPGEAISTETSQLLDFNRALCMVKAALRLVDKIDWVGAYNIGTIMQRRFVRAKKEEETARSIIPSALHQNFLRPVHLPSGMTVAGPRSVIGSAMSGVAPVSVHGIRSGTRAQVVTDMRGNYFRIGIGGARIPLDLQEESSFAGDGLVPDDSASQIGAARRQPLKRIDERPEGFW